MGLNDSEVLNALLVGLMVLIVIVGFMAGQQR